MKLRKLILNNKFEEATKLLSQVVDYDEKIIDYAFEDDNIMYYEFYKYIIERGNTPSKIYWAISKLLSTAFCYLENAYETAYDYLKKAIEAEPDNYIYIANQIYYYNLPLDAPLIDKQQLMDILIQLKKMNKKDDDINKFIDIHLNENEKKALEYSINKC